MIGRAIRVFIQIIGFFAAGFAILFAFFAWRLSSGPISVAFLTPYFESALATKDGNFAIRLEDTILTWVDSDKTLDIRLLGAKAIGSGGVIIAEVPELSVSLSGAALLQGKVAPRSLTIFGPSLRIIRNKDGSFNFGFNDQRQATNRFADRLFEQLLQQEDINNPVSYLNRLNIIEADLTVDDRQQGVLWEFPNAKLVFRKSKNGITGQADLNFRVAEQYTSLKVNVDFHLRTKKINLSVGFQDFKPKTISKLSKGLARLAALDLPTSGKISLATDLSGGIDNVEFDLTAGAGVIALHTPAEFKLNVKSGVLRGSFDQSSNIILIDELMFDLGANGILDLPAPINHVFPATKFSLKAKYDANVERLEINDFIVHLGGPVLAASAVIREIGGDVALETNGRLTGFNFAELDIYWPESWGGNTRSWIAKNVKKGMVSEVSAQLSSRISHKKEFTLVSLGGDMRLKNVSLDYFSPMAPATKINARAIFDHQSIEFFIADGVVDELNLAQGRVKFTGLDQVDQFASIKLLIKGPLRSSLALIDSKPFEFAKAVGIDPKSLKGNTVTQLNLNFIVEKSLTADQVKFAVETTMNDVFFPDVVDGLALEAKKLVLVADKKAMEIKGLVKVGGLLANFEWRELFAASEAPRTRYRINGKINSRDLGSKLNLAGVSDLMDNIQGLIGAELEVNIDRAGKGSLTSRLDLTDATLKIPKTGWRKLPKIAALATVDFAFQDNAIKDKVAISMIGGGLDLSGELAFDDKYRLTHIVVSKFKVGKTDAFGDAVPMGVGWKLRIGGQQLDLIDWFENVDTDNAKIEKRGTPVSISINVKNVHLRPDRVFKSVIGEMEYDGLVWRTIKLKGDTGSGNILRFDVKPVSGKRQVLLKSNDAGATLRFLDVYDDLTGGRLNFTAVYDSMRPDARLSGSLKIQKFRIIKAPLLAQLLTFASLTGILENLGKEGLAFENLDAPFVKDKGVITISKTVANGISIGITAAGTINMKTEVLNVKGTVVPAYLINNALTKIPLIGDILSGGEKGGGVFAANYTMKGRLKEPVISTNPLSAIAPGFFRKLFRVLEADKNQTPLPGDDS